VGNILSTYSLDGGSSGDERRTMNLLILGTFPESLKGLSHQLEFKQKWYNWKEQKRKRNADVFKFFSYLRFFIKFIKTAVLRGTRQKMSKICGDPLSDRQRDHFASFWLKTWWEMCPLGLHFYLGIFSFSVSATGTLKALLKMSLNALQAFPKESPRVFRRISLCLGIGLGISFTFPLKQDISVY
jgi:hypothetical protein